jgi:hypothetical protein
VKAQEYPRWFLEPGSIECERMATGYSEPTFNRDYAASYGFANAMENLALQTSIEVSGGELFWSTEGGKYFLGSDIRETIFADEILRASCRLKRADVFTASNLVLVLAVDDDCELTNDKFKRVEISNAVSPEWTNAPPQKEGLYFAVGIAPEYYHEMSSWREAERMARRNLAAEVYSRFSQKRIIEQQGRNQRLTVSEGQAIQLGEVNALLRNTRILARWRDTVRKMFYVLLCMKKEQ